MFLLLRLEAAGAVGCLEFPHAVTALQGGGAGRVGLERELGNRSAAFGALQVHCRYVDHLTGGETALSAKAALVVEGHSLWLIFFRRPLGHDLANVLNRLIFRRFWDL
jgi:hypothetical protein